MSANALVLLREHARAMARQHCETQLRWKFARALVARAVRTYWTVLESREAVPLRFPDYPCDAELRELKPREQKLADAIGLAAAELADLEAGYQLGTIYTVTVPEVERATFGVYYTPPVLVDRLLDMAERAGIDWSMCRVLDPACGGGAFLAPVAKRMRSALVKNDFSEILEQIAVRLRGFEIDPFAAWVSQVLLSASLRDLLRARNLDFPWIVQVGDALARHQPRSARFDLVVGNPPYGRLGRLDSGLRTAYARSLYGHANAYGLFTDLALRWTADLGVVAFVTPTSCIGGAYYKALRRLMINEAPPVEIDFLTYRRGVFDSVLQETMLVCYQRGASAQVTVSALDADERGRVELTELGTFDVDGRDGEPWLLPRARSQSELVARLSKMPHRLGDYGWRVSTGPLVWNRHKDQLRDGIAPGRIPIIWAEAVTADGRFVWRSDRRTHKPWFATELPRDEWLVVRQSCVLVQRTTAKEQRRRLIAAELPSDFLERFGCATIENHLNMIRPAKGTPRTSAATIAAVLRSAVVDAAFRCINGSVAVSAAELEALPMPEPRAMAKIDALVASGTAIDFVEQTIQKAYGLENATNVASDAA